MTVKVGDKLKTTGLKYYATLSLPPGKYAVKSLVRSVETDHRGYARTDDDIADHRRRAGRGDSDVPA